MSDLSDVTGLLQLATSGGFAALTWFLIVKALPNMQTRFDATITQLITRFEIQQDRQREYSENVIKGIIERYEKQLDRLIKIQEHRIQDGLRKEGAGQ